MAFGSIASTPIYFRTDTENQYLIHVLPEINPLMDTGKQSVFLFREHYAIQLYRKKLDRRKPVTLHLHRKNLIVDLFEQGNGNALNGPREILRRLKQGGNELLLVVDTNDRPSRINWENHTGLPFPAGAKPGLIGLQFAKALGFNKHIFRKTPERVTFPFLNEDSFDLNMTMGNFRIFRQDEVIHTGLTPQVLQRMFPDLSLSDSTFLKPLTHYLFVADGTNANKTPRGRVHSECATGDFLGSCRCDCGPQLFESLICVSKYGGFVAIHASEGRGLFSLFAKMLCYAEHLKGVNTYDSMRLFGYPNDCRDYRSVVEFLGQKGFKNFKLMTNNPSKIQRITQAGKEWGVTVSEVTSLVVPASDHAKTYLETKRTLGGHTFNKIPGQTLAGQVVSPV